MRQILPKAAFWGGYGATTMYGGVADGQGTLPYSVTFRRFFGAHPLALASTFVSLTVVASAPVRVTLLVNNVATELSVVVSAPNTPVSVVGSVVCAPGDSLSYQFFSGFVEGGYDVACTLERDGDGMVFGITPAQGSLDVNTGWYGGALGNGVFQTHADGDFSKSNTYSINAVAGVATTLVLRAYESGEPGAGIWTAYLWVNNVRQDGSGGTVDTTCVLTGANTTALATFALPVAIGDQVEVELLRTGAAQPFAVSNVGAGVGMIPTTDGEFMFCGGNNHVIPTTVTGWKWTSTRELAPDEDQHEVTLGPTGFDVVALYVERNAAPTPGNGFTHSVRQSGVTTALAVTLMDLEVSGLDTGTVTFAPGDTLTLQIENISVPVGSQLHWGLRALIPPEVPPDDSSGDDSSVDDSSGDDSSGDDSSGDDACVIDVPSASCWTPGVPSVACAGDDDVPAAASWSPTFDPTDLGVGLKDHLT